ncbi:MAG: GtrA family protein [Clostridiales bacterium]|nr:GtrA family protein [Clostridiales bacterium]
MIEKIKGIYKKHEALILYVFFGGLTTLVSWITHFGAREFLSTSVRVATVFSWVCAVTFAFITNKKYVFKSKAVDFKDLFRQIWLFFAARLVSLGVEVLIMDLCADKYRNTFIKLFRLDRIEYGKGLFKLELISTAEKLNELIFKLFFASIIILVMNYAFSKVVVFRKKLKK